MVNNYSIESDDSLTSFGELFHNLIEDGKMTIDYWFLNVVVGTGDVTTSTYVVIVARWLTIFYIITNFMRSQRCSNIWCFLQKSCHLSNPVHGISAYSELNSIKISHPIWATCRQNTGRLSTSVALSLRDPVHSGYI